jgi:hypothetical protein
MIFKKIAALTLAASTLSFPTFNLTAIAAIQPNALTRTVETLKPNRVLVSLNDGEQVIGDINEGDADHHCKYWFQSSAYVAEFNSNTSVAVCSRNSKNEQVYGDYEGNSTETTNISFDTLCFGKYESNGYTRIPKMGWVRYDYDSQACVGTPGSKWW